MLETRKIFIDTQYFVKSNFNFHSQSFKSLQKLCESNEIQYYLTSVVEREVDNRIKLSIKDSLNSLKQFKRKANILSTIEDQQLSTLFADVAEDDVYEKASNVFHAYNQACNYEYVEADAIDSEKLLALYFEVK
ncbi:PIN domain-containing protein [Psychromonas antarctica]|uniref:PIN domain-containing protein n=1 Tax=Psychromonas antarctica TaxID=67573 RepID=UPI001EE94FD7|nr:PIN domain-containing protein [Psychromonas antarctica]MCG6202845.1 PIN domain-containing protein [Psychromonas antarctica]